MIIDYTLLSLRVHRVLLVASIFACELQAFCVPSRNRFFWCVCVCVSMHAFLFFKQQLCFNIHSCQYQDQILQIFNWTKLIFILVASFIFSFPA